MTLRDAIPASGRVDLLTAYAAPLPITVICELLGVPPADREAFRTWSVTVTSASSAQLGEHASALLAYRSELVERKRAEPGDDPCPTWCTSATAATGSPSPS
ncbi:hypothetical protein [Symbioplanes lichenis]|uniref:hypothetical protein n=1 Tax=Symbioplanes lichenis TaxID=1629072 RepID=UPI0027392C55|nr:hypothetical protein [Actinoplanes lichenis]